MQLDPDEIRNYEQRAFFEKKEVHEVNPWSIFIAVLAAILVAWFIHEMYLEWQIRRALTIFNEQMEVVNRQTQQQFQEIQIRNEYQQAKEMERVRLESEYKEQQRRLVIERENQIHAQKMAVVEEKNAKETAWGKFYKPTLGCGSENPNRDAIKCGNDYIRERKRFESGWIYIPR